MPYIYMRLIYLYALYPQPKDTWFYGILDKIFITNVITNKTIRIKHTDHIPDGWIRAGVKKGKSNGCKVWAYSVETNECGMFKDENSIPDGWIRGRPKSHSNSNSIKNKNMKWYTDGKHNMLLKKDDVIPIGFKLGRTKSQQERINNKITNKLMGENKITITNGHVIKKHDKNEPIPHGYVRGMKLVKKNKPYNNKNDLKWKHVESTELYLSDEYEVITINNRILKQYTSKTGIFIEYKCKKIYLHELICKLKFNYDSSFHCIVHLDGNVLNNKVDNLQIKFK